MSYNNGQYPPPPGGYYGVPGPYPPQNPQVPPPQYRQPYYPPPQYRPYFAPQPNPWDKPIRRNGNIVCVGLLIVTLLGMFLLPVYQAVADLCIESFGITAATTLSAIDMLGDLVIYALVFIIPLIIMKLWIGIPAGVAFPIRRARASIVAPSVGVCLGAAVVGVLTYGVITMVLESLFGITPIMPPAPDPVGLTATIIYFLSVTLAPSILEEMMFRGVIMQSLRRFGDTFALVSSAILFSLAHHNLVQGPNALLQGLVIGYFVLRTNSLLTGMVIHFVNNSLAVCIELLTKNMPAAQYEKINMAVFALYILLGLVGMVMLILQQGSFVHLTPSSYPVVERKKYKLFFVAVAPILYIIAIIAITCLQFERVY